MSVNSYVKTKNFLNGKRPKTVCIVGNGIIENGWGPYRHHLSEVKNHGYDKETFKEIISVPDPSIFLARHAYRLRFARSRLLKLAIENQYDDDLLKVIMNLKNISDSIAQKFNLASQGILPNVEIKIRNHSLFDHAPPDETGIITLNWDSLLWNDTGIGNNIIQLHGVCTKPESLILPTEFAIDDYLLWNVIEKTKNGLLDDAFRDKEISVHLFTAQKLAEEWLRNAENIIVYGTAFNSYDSELLSIIPVNSSNIKKLIVINPNETHQKTIARAFGITSSKCVFMNR